MLMKEMEDDRNRWKDMPCSWIGIINTININILPKAIYRFRALPIRLPMPSFTEPKHFFLICMETQKNGTARAILRMKHGAGGIRPPDFRLYCKL